MSAKTKVSIVEDDINMRKSLEFALSEYEEFEIKCFKSALDALKKMPEDTDIVVTDINMPGMDGLAFAKELAGKYDICLLYTSDAADDLTRVTPCSSRRIDSKKNKEKNTRDHK